MCVVVEHKAGAGDEVGIGKTGDIFLSARQKQNMVIQPSLSGS